MPVFSVTVKWGKEKYVLDLDTSEPVEDFKALLMSHTGVVPDRQKLILKGSILKDSWDSLKGLKQGAIIQLMGSATALPEAPVEKTLFEEDMSEQQRASQLKIPAGLENLGNTCYMSATVQCLRTIPELQDALSVYSNPSMNQSTVIVKELKNLVHTLQNSSESVKPMLFLNSVFSAFPRFAEVSEHGGFVQQDANEFWVELVQCIQQELIRTGKTKSFVDEFFRLNFAQSLKCVESAEEPVTSQEDKAYQLSCFIDSNVKHLFTGLKNKLKENLEKHSSVLDRNAVYEKTSLISRLPAYLSIQLIRFEYKKAKAVNAKILKDVKFTPSLDVFELCSPELQSKLIPMRERFKAEEERQDEERKQAQLKGEPLKKDRKINKEPFSFADDEGSNNSGMYELQAVLTHKGRASSSGHYVAWVKETADRWIMFDDDKISYVTLDKIKELSGGGDWHTAYVLLYGPRILEVEEAPKVESMQE
ncbi:USP14 [Bugula neritina]|uniref:Ubiquitin carboxyl-terminal hydrolase n=1 Tax=Bugula neritina TaxID=10212 RepID=A0A7J7JHN5_BUGNE|nr:USP14 [Bugula neritina]